MANRSEFRLNRTNKNLLLDRIIDSARSLEAGISFPGCCLSENVTADLQEQDLHQVGQEDQQHWL